MADSAKDEPSMYPPAGYMDLYGFDAHRETQERRWEQARQRDLRNTAKTASEKPAPEMK